MSVSDTQPRFPPAAVLAVIAIGVFMALLDLTVVNIAIPSIIDGLAVLAGPTVGGFIVTHWGWRWIFYVNLPVGILAIVLTLLIVPDLRPGRRHRLDLLGVALATAGLLGVVFGLIEGQRYNWGTVQGFLTIPRIIGAGVLVLLIFLVSQALRQNRELLLPFAVFADRNFSLMTLVLCAMGFATLGLFLPLTIYYQSVLGLSSVDAGLTIAAQPVAMIIGSSVAAGLVQKPGGKILLIPGLALFAAGMGNIDWVAHVDSGRWRFLPGLIAGGFGLGFVWTPVYSLATQDPQPHLAGVASGVLNTIQELGGVIASAAVGALLQDRLATALHSRAVHERVSCHLRLAASSLPASATPRRTVSRWGADRAGGACTYRRVSRTKRRTTSQQWRTARSPTPSSTRCGRP